MPSLLKRTTGKGYWRIAKNWFFVKSSTIMAPGKFKNWWLRRTGAKIHKTCFISPDVTLDPVYPELIELEENTFLGFGARLMTHVVYPNGDGTTGINANPIKICKGAFIGGYSTVRGGTTVEDFAIIGSDCLIKENLTIGKKSTVYDYSVVTKYVPENAKVRGVPAKDPTAIVLD